MDPLAAKFSRILESHYVGLLGEWSLENMRCNRDLDSPQILYRGMSNVVNYIKVTHIRGPL